MDDELKANLSDTNQWVRLLYMLLFFFVLYPLSLILYLLVIILAGFALVTGQPNENLRDFGRGLASYTYEILLFLTYNEERIPFPFSPWPEVEGEKSQLEQQERE